MHSRRGTAYRHGRQHTITCGEITLPLAISVHPRARRITLRYNPLDSCVSLTVPRFTAIRDALAFADSKRTWLAAIIGSHGGKTLIAEGASVPVFGVPHLLQRTGQARGTVQQREGILQIPGDASHCARRTKDWLKRHLQHHIAARILVMAAQIGAQPRRVTVRDTRSRWGSCSHDGKLSFSWRLVFAPVAVVDYVIAHEMAHLHEMNHSPRFWQWVETLHPGWRTARDWLKREGHTLYRFEG